MLTAVLQPRAEEHMEFVRAQIAVAVWESLGGAGVVLTGGGARLNGF